MCITHTRLWLAIGLVVLVALIVVACAPETTQPSADTTEDSVAQPTQTPTPEEPVAQPTQTPTPTPEEPTAQSTPPRTPTPGESVEQPSAAVSLDGLLTSGQEALEANDMDMTRHELREALEIASGAQKAQIEDILKDLEEGELEEVEEHLKELLGEDATLGAQEADADAIEDGRALFLAKACAACHGQNAEGTELGPALSGHTAEQIRGQVRDPQEKMPAFTEEQLSDDELAKIIAFITSLAPP